MRRRIASGSLVGTSTSAPLFASSSEEETVYCNAVGIPSSTDEKKLNSLRSWYQIPDDLNPHLVDRGEWCCQPHFGVSIYKAYLLWGLRFALLVSSIAGFFKRFLGLEGSAIMTTTCVSFSLILSLIAFYEVALGASACYLRIAPWVSPETFDASCGFFSDSEVIG